MREDEPINRKKQLLILLTSVFLISFSLIALEISVTRLLSVLLSYHYVFVVLSLALLGLGLGGIFVHLFRPKIPTEKKGFTPLAFFSSFFSLAILIFTLFVVKFGYIPNIQLNILFCGLVLLGPFFWAGVILAEVYRIFPSISSRIYGVDLIGAALGAPVAILFLNRFGAMSTNLILGVVASLSAVLFAIGGSKKKQGLLVSISCLLILLGFLGINRAGFLSEIPIGKNPSKEIHEALSFFKGRIIESRWSAFGRTDLVAFSDDPGHMDIYLDGTAGSPMYRFNGDIQNPGSNILHLRETFPGYFPFFFLKEEERDNALIIGPGGGRDILLALMGGVREITAVEINKDLVDMVSKYSLYNGGIFTKLPQVKIIVDEGRNFLKRQKGKYDLIMLSLPVTNTSRSLEGYALTENFLFTTDSILDYIENLTNEGSLMIVGHNDAEILRLLSISLCSLSKKGISPAQAMNQIYIVASDEYLLFLLKKTPFEATAVFPMDQTIHQFGYDLGSSYFPYMQHVGGYNPALIALNHGKIVPEDLIKMVKDRGYDISPVTDDNPFFYKIEKDIPKAISFIFWSSMILLAIVILIPPFFWKRILIQPEAPSRVKGYLGKIPLKFVAFFSMLGIGFMLIEISFFQKFVFFLGQPVLSLAVLLFSLLIGASIGSFWSGIFASNKINRFIALTALCIVGLTLVYALLLPLILRQLFGLNLSIRLLTTVLLLIPLGFSMGIPFPLGIRLLKERKMENQIPWMWGVNGVGSVLGSVMTIVVAVHLGFTPALLISAGCYFIIFLIFLKGEGGIEE